MGMGKLQARVALITGAGRGLGQGMALGFAEEGAHVAVHYRTSVAGAREAVATIRAGGGKAEAFQADLTDADQVDRVVADVLKTFGRIDILVNNAGIVGTSSLLVDMPIAMWDAIMASHVRTMFLCTRAVLPHMLTQRYGKIINISGSFGISGQERFAHMSAAKAAMIAFTRALAKEVGPHNICVNCIAAAMIQTEAVKKLPADFLERLRQSYPMRRLGKVRDHTATAIFLASAEADFFTGQTLAPSGGHVMV
jgi:3-oxoacyl-[acyl-carrier protein] reductase